MCVCVYLCVSVLLFGLLSTGPMKGKIDMKNNLKKKKKIDSLFFTERCPNFGILDLPQFSDFQGLAFSFLSFSFPLPVFCLGLWMWLWHGDGVGVYDVCERDGLAHKRREKERE